MSYQYSSYQKTTTSDGYSTTTTTTTTTGGSDTSLVVRELTETEVTGLDNNSQYQISDEDRLTKYDFYSLMESEDDEVSSESESDVEHHWFPSLLNKSVIEFLEDNDEEYMDQDDNDNVLVIETTDEDDEDDNEIEDDSQQEFEFFKQGGKRFNKHHSKKRTKRPRKSDIVPVEVVHVIL